MKSVAIIVSAGQDGLGFVRYMNLAGLLASPAPPGHRYAGIRGPYELYLVDGTTDQVREAAALHGGGGQFEEGALTDDPDSPVASVLFGGFPW
jgi:hypothetical protein